MGMHTSKLFLLKVLKKLYKSIFYKSNNPYKLISEYDGSKSSELIYNALISDKPCMIARFGSNELNIYLNYLSIYKQQKSFSEFIRGKQFDWVWNRGQIELFRDVAGFFPVDEKYLKQFGELMDKDISELDLLASWIPHEEMIVSKRKY
jgi:hypothetical protein